jgi:hypothetical protein
MITSIGAVYDGGSRVPVVPRGFQADPDNDWNKWNRWNN